MTTHYDAIIVGTGQSGPPLADRMNREGLKVDMNRVKTRMKEISGQSNTNVTRWIENMENVRLYRCHARLESPAIIVANVGKILRLLGLNTVSITFDNTG